LAAQAGPKIRIPKESTLSDLKQYLIDEFTYHYEEGRMSRRDALRQIAAVTGSLALASTILAACTSPSQQQATTPAPPPTSPPSSGAAAASPAAAVASPTSAAAAAAGTAGPLAVQASKIEFPGQGVTLIGYLARPTTGGPYPAVLICHENRGATEHFRELPSRFAQAGFVALSVDLVSRQGGTEGITDRAAITAALRAPDEQFVQDFQSGMAYLNNQTYVRRGAIGMTGFCFGGGVVWRVATKTPDLRAAVPFYGSNPPLEEVPNIRAAVLAIYGENDNFANRGIPAIEAAMQQNNKTFEKIIYPGAGHGFFNPEQGQGHHAPSAADSWEKMNAWFRRYLTG
jgi:carboxymethylenebutenolidase